MAHGISSEHVLDDIDLGSQNAPSFSLGAKPNGEVTNVKPETLGHRELPVVEDGTSGQAGNHSCTTDMESDRQRDLILRARCISIFSLAASTVVAFLGISLGLAEETISLIGFGCEALLDAISSALVVWRFKTPKRKQFQDQAEAEAAQQRRNAVRERNSAIGIGCIFCFSAVMLLLSAVSKITSWDPTTEEHIEEERQAVFYASLLAWPSAFIFGGLAIVKFKLGQQLKSQVLEKDALCSVLGAIMAFVCAIAAIIEQVSSGSPEEVVWVDAAAGSTIALILFIEGARTLWHNRAGGDWASDHRSMG